MKFFGVIFFTAKYFNTNPAQFPIAGIVASLNRLPVLDWLPLQASDNPQRSRCLLSLPSLIFRKCRCTLLTLPKLCRPCASPFKSAALRATSGFLPTLKATPCLSAFCHWSTPLQAIVQLSLRVPLLPLSSALEGLPLFAPFAFGTHHVALLPSLGVICWVLI